MKKAMLIFLLGSFSISNLSAQYTAILGSESTSWNMAVKVFLPFEGITLWGDRTYVTNDTMINNLEYKTLEWDGLSSEFSNEAKGYVREDTINGMAWYVAAGEEEEYLIMDLSLEVGDTFFINTFQNEGWHLVDSVYFLEGKKHVQVDYEITIDYLTESEKFTMIEGVGTNIGLHYQVPGFTEHFRYYTLCQQKNNTFFYTNNSPNFEGQCDVLAVGVEGEIKNAIIFNIFPNPAKNTLIVDIEDTFFIKNKGETLIEVYDVGGKLVLTQYAHFFPERLEVSGLAKGLYFIIIGRQAVSKFVKE